MSRLYLDNAATSWPKPEAVYAAVDAFQRENGASAGRGAYRESQEASRIVEHARAGIAHLLGAESPERIVFTFNGTDSLNLAIHGIVRPGDHVVTTVCDHNSVLRPLRQIAESQNVSVTYVPCDAQGWISEDDICDALRPNTRLVAVVHASNVTGAVQPIRQIGEIARAHGATFLVDAAQTAGHWPIDLAKLPIDLLAAPGHKGLLGPVGTGILYVRPGVEHYLQSFRQGGTGSQSEEDRQPKHLPDKYESGNHNVAGLTGLGAAAEYLNNQTVAKLHLHHTELTGLLLDGLRSIDGLTIHGPECGIPHRTSVVSVSLAGYDPHDLAAILELQNGIQCRAGLHCAPRMHEALGTTKRGGTVRFSPGWANTTADVDRLIVSLNEIAAVTPV